MLLIRTFYSNINQKKKKKIQIFFFFPHIIACPMELKSRW